MKTSITDGLPANSPALLVHDCFTEYHELQKSGRWWNRKHHAAVLHSYNSTLRRLHQALANHNGNGAKHEGNNRPC